MCACRRVRPRHSGSKPLLTPSSPSRSRFWSLKSGCLLTRRCCASEALGPRSCHLWPSYVGYLISFIVIGIMWANHHNMMKLIDRVDHGFITLTLLLLLCIAFLPFPTAVMAEHLADPDPHERAVAVAFYCGCFTLTGIFYFLVWWHAARGRRLIASHVPDEAVRAITRSLTRPGSFALSDRDAARLRPRGGLSLAIVVGLAVLYMMPKAGAHAAVTTTITPVTTCKFRISASYRSLIYIKKKKKKKKVSSSSRYPRSAGSGRPSCPDRPPESVRTSAPFH